MLPSKHHGDSLPFGRDKITLTELKELQKGLFLIANVLQRWIMCQDQSSCPCLVVLFHPKLPHDHLSLLFYSNDTCTRKSSYQPRKDKDSNLNKKHVNKGTLKNSHSNFKQRRSNDTLFLKQHL